ncbi:MAG: DNA recombination protein RmuC [Gammaproteobacteria bacterium]|nr:DNA recombination protein RmuC [Gammaproteobacteria bacterium]
MMFSSLFLAILLLVVAAIGILIGYLIASFRQQKQILKLSTENTELTIRLESEKKTIEKNIQLFNEQKQQLAEKFESLSSQVLKQNSEDFLKLAKANLSQYQQQAKHELDKKENAFSEIIKPIRETIEKTRAQLLDMEKDRKEAHGSLSKHLESMATSQNILNAETRNLVQAFRRPEVRGQWGEMTLKRLAELAGLVEHCDFSEQTTVHDEEGARHRPDMIVRLPAGREIIVDSKTPLDAYLDAIEATTDAEKEISLQRHLKHVKQRIKELASKAYWHQFSQSPDFVVLFIPGDQFLNAALDQDRSLIEDALQNKVIIATPTSFVALLRAVAFGWRQETLAENAEQIKKLGEEMYGRMATFSENLSKVGKSLDQSVGHYNKAVASLTTRIMPNAKKFKELGIETKKELNSPDPIEKTTRTIDLETTN